MPSPVLLDHRAVLIVSGADAETFLQGLITVSSLGMARRETRYGALLTPQGKVIADMLLTRTDDGFLIDCDATVSTALAKRLSLFRLRANVSIEERSGLGVIAFEGAPDPRSPLAPARRIAPRKDAPIGSLEAYHAARIAAGLPEQGSDFAAEEVFPADINMDLVGGVDFKKGCFVGQEVVSRMKRRGAARRRTLKAVVPEGLVPPLPVLADDFEIGRLTSTSSGAGLVRARIDRMADAQAKGEPITVQGQLVTFDTPVWLAGELQALAAAREGRA